MDIEIAKLIVLLGLAIILMQTQSIINSKKIGKLEAFASKGDENVKLSRRQRISLRFGGRVYLEHRTKEGWSGALPFYMARCPVHGVFEDYPHGFSEYLSCPECGKDRMKVQP